MAHCDGEREAILLPHPSIFSNSMNDTGSLSVAWDGETLLKHELSLKAVS